MGGREIGGKEEKKGEGEREIGGKRGRGEEEKKRVREKGR